MSIILDQCNLPFPHPSPFFPHPSIISNHFYIFPHPLTRLGSDCEDVLNHGRGSIVRPAPGAGEEVQGAVETTYVTTMISSGFKDV